MSPWDTDVTGWCRRADHDRCSSKLLTKSGFHWFCACPCHPVPTLGDISPTAPRAHAVKALRTFELARHAIEV